MKDISIRIEGRAGRITLQRPDALNALSYDMVLAIEAALDDWRGGDVDLVIFDAQGDRAFCAGGDIADMYASARRGDLEYGRQFWRDEYRLNAKIFEYPKPVVSFLQGFTMGGGVGVGCHGSHRIVGETSQIAMPECAIGLVPDVGGSLMLALAPGRVGEYLATTGFRMGPSDAIHAGFADCYVPQTDWPDLIARLCKGLIAAVADAARPPPDGKLPDIRAEIDAHFAGETLGDIYRSLLQSDDSFAQSARKSLDRHAPLAMGCTVQIIRRLRSAQSIRQALDQEYRYTYRAAEQGDFIEGIRAAIIDKDRSPKWTHKGPMDLDNAAVTRMLMPLGEAALNWEGMP